MSKTDKILYGGFAAIALANLVLMLVFVFSPQSEQATSDPVITNDPKQKEDEDELWKSRKDWEERFPFNPTFHPEITFNPDVFPANKERKRLVKNHGFLRSFYKSRLPYTEEFEQMYDIIKEEVGEEKAGDTITLGWTFNTLRRYHHAKAYNPNAIYKKNTVKASPNMYHPQIMDVTWGEEAESLKRRILGDLTRNYAKPGQLRISVAQARAIQKRLINEIPAEGFLEMPRVAFAYNQKYEKELKAGDRLLIK